MNLQAKIVASLEDLRILGETLHSDDYEIVWTNGVFDLLHQGHIRYLNEASELGEVLIVGVNSDASVKRLKGENRPIFDQETRLLKLAAMEFVDFVFLFEDDTPIEAIKAVKPNWLVKGGDYEVEKIVGYKEVMESGGEVVTIDFVPGYSSSDYIKKIQENDQN